MTWFYEYFLPLRFTKKGYGQNQKKLITALLDELIRVTNHGGEIRLSLNYLNLMADGFQHLLQAIENHSLVLSFEYRVSLPNGPYLAIYRR
jgi:hypothetical protein